MAYVSSNYKTNSKAPMKKWVCTRTSSEKVYDTEPPADKTKSPNYCGQCVSFVTTVCPTIPVSTNAWKKGALVKGNTDILPGTAIATFNNKDKYSGHAAIYDGQTSNGINVVDQWVTPPASPIHQRTLKFGAHGNSNNGDNFYVID
jgi:hypothetical protein